MCGIAGLILSQPDARAGPLVEAMTQRLWHRGPDDGGAAVFGPAGELLARVTLGTPTVRANWNSCRGTLALGARRLAINDLSPAGHQPMSTPDGHAWIVFNGEIYNHAELRDELRARGVPFAGHCDTEVALAAYRAWGPDCLERFRGMWALAIFDAVAGRVVLSRDRLGIKPLYLAEFEGGYGFASEIKSLLTLPGLSREANAARLRDFLVAGRTDHSRDTLFEAIWSLEPGGRLDIDLRPRTTTSVLGTLHCFWPPESADPAEGSGDPDRVADRTAALLDDSLRLHLGGDVPVGSCLSGGLDSSAIVTSIPRLADHSASRWSQHTFSAVLPGDPLDESRYVDAVHVALPGLIDHRITPTPQRLLDDVDRLIWHQEEPFGSPSIYMQWEVMRRVGEAGVKVVLDGQGGDELFRGYPGYLPVAIAHWLRRGRVDRALGSWRLARHHHSPIALLRHTLAQLLPDAAVDSLRRRRDERNAAHLDPELLDSFDEPLPPYRRRVPRDAPNRPQPGRSREARFAWRQLLYDSLPALLRHEDRNSMAFSIEARVPFLDHPLVAFAMALPPQEHYRDGRTKSVLRRAMSGRVPDTIRDRTEKIGFAAPTQAWLTGPLRDWCRDLMASQSFRERGCFDVAGCRRLADRLDHGDPGAVLPVWRLAITEAWARRMLDGPG